MHKCRSRSPIDISEVRAATFQGYAQFDSRCRACVGILSLCKISTIPTHDDIPWNPNRLEQCMGLRGTVVRVHAEPPVGLGLARMDRNGDRANGTATGERRPVWNPGSARIVRCLPTRAGPEISGRRRFARRRPAWGTGVPGVVRLPLAVRPRFLPCAGIPSGT